MYIETLNKKTMKITNEIRSKVMKAAWTTFRKRNWSFSACLKSAWRWAKETLINTGINGYSILKETAKAVLIAGQLSCYTTDQVVSANFWCPKSLINDGSIAEWFFNKKVNELKEEHSYYGASLGFELI